MWVRWMLESSRDRGWHGLEHVARSLLNGRLEKKRWNGWARYWSIFVREKLWKSNDASKYVVWVSWLA